MTEQQQTNPEAVEALAKPTERDVLDALHRRHCLPPDRLRPPRYVLAEHVSAGNTYSGLNRVLDAVAVDCWRGSMSLRDPDQGYGLHGYEVKVTRSDLRRELADPTKAAAFTDEEDLLGRRRGLLTTFSVVGPADVLIGWRDLDIPETWGVLQYQPARAPSGALRYLRKPTVLRDRLALSVEAVAMLSRSIAKTARHCERVHGDA